MKNKHLLLITVLFVLLTSFSPGKAMATSWAYEFVVWDGYIYVISDEYVSEIGGEIGQVTKHSDMEQYSGNFSNAYKKGTKYYAIKDISTEKSIAIQESKGRYIKADRKGEYEYESAVDEPQDIFITLFFSILSILAGILIYKILKNKCKQKPKRL